ncbi:MAG: hypothetical protein DMG65_12550 [Candidatus Angelobacter sp. Gp1-AA117]|nr:MAG: hypothetical protein DMG65_12550 [Candidatus Angelobacter sp. Gp1-AA117]
MYRSNSAFIVLVLAALSLLANAQQHNPAVGNKASRKPVQESPRKLTPQQQFVLDTVKMAVALPEPDPQDRLRVLASAANVLLPIDQKLAKNLWREGVRIESELVRLGQTPAVSLMANGQTDCASAQSFIENLPEAAVPAAEQSMIGALTSCPKQTMYLVSRKLDAAMEQKIVAPRALMATIEVAGTKTLWSQTHFQKIFSSLPDAHENAGEAENFAAMYARMATEVDKDVARKTGLQLLEWLSKLDDGGTRTLGINIAGGAMKQALGEQGFQDALSGDVVAGSAVQNAQNPGTTGFDRPPVESVSVLQAMGNNGTDQSDRLRDLPASQRAREAAAHGFAAGTSGDKNQAGKYFDMAFAAVDEVWGARTPEQNAAAVVQEVSEAAAQIDSVNALTRAQKLRESSAQAIAMLAVARVVAGAGVAR